MISEGEPLYATVKRTPRAPRNPSEGGSHIYSYPVPLNNSTFDHMTPSGTMTAEEEQQLLQNLTTGVKLQQLGPTLQQHGFVMGPEEQREMENKLLEQLGNLGGGWSSKGGSL